jgi:hypothetical protein
VSRLQSHLVSCIVSSILLLLAGMVLLIQVQYIHFCTCLQKCFENSKSQHN